MTDSYLLGEVMLRQAEAADFDSQQADMLEQARRRAQGIMSEFDSEMAHIANDDKWSDVGRKSKQAELTSTQAEAARLYFDPLLKRVADQVAFESDRLAAVKLEEADPAIRELRAREIRDGLKDLDELELHARLLEAGTSGNMELLMAIENAPLPMLTQRKPLEDAKRAASEVRNPASAQRLRTLQSLQGALQTAKQGVMSHVGGDITTQLEDLAAGETAAA